MSKIAVIYDPAQRPMVDAVCKILGQHADVDRDMEYFPLPAYETRVVSEILRRYSPIFTLAFLLGRMGESKNTGNILKALTGIEHGVILVANAWPALAAHPSCNRDFVGTVGSWSLDGSVQPPVNHVALGGGVYEDRVVFNNDPLQRLAVLLRKRLDDELHGQQPLIRDSE
ncbi:MAG TPA: hypothetical protein VJL57_01375 [Candidatus Paceibacterota bacterium]